MTDPLLIDEPAAGVLRLTLNRPHKLNALSVDLRDRLYKVVRSITIDRGEVRAVILTGVGDFFCSGGDVDEFEGFLGPQPTDGFQAQMRFQELAQGLWHLPVPVITAINGPALGGGTAVAMMSDLRVASSEATFAVGQVVRAVVPDVGLTYVLPRLVGLGKALELMLLHETIDAQQALDIGLVNWVVPKQEVAAHAVGVATKLAGLSSTALEWIKRTTYQNLDVPMEQALRNESAAQGILGHTSDFHRGIREFEARRAAKRPK